MIRIVAVDDEPPALRRVGKLLETLENVKICGLFEKPTALLEYVLTNSEPIDLALLDMDMPSMHGLELARRLREIRPEIHVAFVTAYQEFAKDAFDVEALDYLLKPIMTEDLDRTIARFLNRQARGESEHEQSTRGVSVHSFGPFTVMSDAGSEVRFRNSKGKELLAYLHYHRGKPVSKEQIMEEIWYGRDMERTRGNLHTTVYQLRKDLEACGLEDPIKQSKIAGGSYSLNWTVSYDDMDEYEREVRQFKNASSLLHALKAVQLYGEGYLAGSGYGWAAPRQTELELGYAELLEAIVDMYVRQQRYEIALQSMRKWAELSPLSAQLHAKMIALLLLMNREKDARSYHQLALELLDQPSDLSEIAFERLFADPLRPFL